MESPALATAEAGKTWTIPAVDRIFPANEGRFNDGKRRDLLAAKVLDMHEDGAEAHPFGLAVGAGKLDIGQGPFDGGVIQERYLGQERPDGIADLIEN